MCCPLTEQGPCERQAQVVLVQLRPDATGRPTVAVVAVCLPHLRAVRTTMRETWPHDDVTSMSVDHADEHLAVLLEHLTEDGASVLTSAGVA